MGKGGGEEEGGWVGGWHHSLVSSKQLPIPTGKQTLKHTAYKYMSMALSLLGKHLGQ